MMLRYFKSSLFGRAAATLLITGALAAGNTVAQPNQLSEHRPQPTLSSR